MNGFVSLVGAGPGDPELLTRRALDRMERADLILYDALVPSAMKRLAPRARWRFVGKRAGRPFVDQETIHRILLRAARRGERVVRLKAGDPCVLGRGGEEALVLAEAGIPYEIVPGVTAATAAPLLAGIPLTHRGVASGFLVVSGHEEASFRPILEGITPGSLTLVVLMGVRTRGALAALLQERGWSADTPAALLLGASLPGGTTWIGTLAALGHAPIPDAASEHPGTVVVGEVVALAARIAWPRDASPVAAPALPLRVVGGAR